MGNTTGDIIISCVIIHSENYGRVDISIYNPSYRGKIEKVKANYKCEITCGPLFPPNAELFCEINLETSDGWSILNEFSQKLAFQIHCCTNVVRVQVKDYSEEGLHAWSHPFDIHLATNSLIEWPKFLIRVWRLSLTRNLDIVAYGTYFLPNIAEASEVVRETWRPRTTPLEEFQAFFLGGTPITSRADLMNLSSLENLGSQSSGRVHTYCETIPKNFKYLSIKSDTIQFGMCAKCNMNNVAPSSVFSCGQQNLCVGCNGQEMGCLTCGNGNKVA